jgi:hypothetical protein
MKARDVQKILRSIDDTVTEAIDHLAERFGDAADSLGHEYAHLADFSRQWKGLKKDVRRLFAEQLVRSAGLVMAGSLATKAGLKFAGKSQKEIRKVILTAAAFLGPIAASAGGKARKKAKKAKKRLEKAAR